MGHFTRIGLRLAVFIRGFNVTNYVLSFIHRFDAGCGYPLPERIDLLEIML